MIERLAVDVWVAKFSVMSGKEGNMSRIGKEPISVPSDVQVSIEGRSVGVTGPKGSLDLDLPGEINVRQEDSTVLVERPNDDRKNKALHGLTRSLINNMVIGVSEGFKKELEIVGVGYRAAKSGDGLELQLGFSHPIKVKAPDGITFDVPEPTQIIVSGINKEVVGQVAADIRSYRKPEPYKGKGIRYAGEYVARKAGKAAK